MGIPKTHRTDGQQCCTAHSASNSQTGVLHTGGEIARLFAPPRNADPPDTW